MATTEKKIDTKVNKELKEEFLKIINESDDKYYRNYIEDVCRINNENEYFYIGKPHIQKSFCFGYGMYLQSTSEEEDIASDNARRAATDVTYFINENLSEINSKIATVKYFLIDNYEEKEKYFREMYDKGLMSYASHMKEPYLIAPYISTWGKCAISLSYFDEFDNEVERDYVLRKATKEELENILKFYEKARARFVKRLNTYLKKYGLSKLNIWTYLVD